MRLTPANGFPCSRTKSLASSSLAAVSLVLTTYWKENVFTRLIQYLKIEYHKTIVSSSVMQVLRPSTTYLSLSRAAVQYTHSFSECGGDGGGRAMHGWVGMVTHLHELLPFGNVTLRPGREGSACSLYGCLRLLSWNVWTSRNYIACWWIYNLNVWYLLVNLRKLMYTVLYLHAALERTRFSVAVSRVAELPSCTYFKSGWRSHKFPVYETMIHRNEFCVSKVIPAIGAILCN